MIIAIIPAFNEEDTIGSVVLGTKKYVDKVIVVDDGSKDKTAEIAQLAGADVVQHIQNGGKGSALKTGFEFAEKLQADVVVCIDADAQHNPDYIPKVIAPVLSGEAEMVIASRYVNEEHKKCIPKFRRFGLWVLTTTTNLGSKCKITDTQCGFRAFSGNVIGKFNFGQNGLSVESEMIEDAIDNHIKIKEVSFIPKYNGSDTPSEKPTKHGLRVLSFIIRAVKDRRPLLFFGVSGAILLIIGLAFGVYSLSSFFKNDQLPFGPSLAASILILMGALCVFAGLILNSISGMIRGLHLLNHRQGEPHENNIQRRILSSPHRGGRLPADIDDIDEQKIHGVTASSHNPQDMLLGDIDKQKIQGVTASNPLPQDMLAGDINDKKIQGVTVSNNPRGETLLEDIDEDNVRRQTQLNNHRAGMLPEDIDEKNIQM